MKMIPIKVTVAVIIILLIPIFAFYMPITTKKALVESGAEGLVCVGYDYEHPQSKKYHILLGKLPTYISLKPIPAQPYDCSRPVKAELYL